MQNKKIIFWRNNPLDVDYGLFSKIAETSNNELIVICDNDLDDDRKKIGCNENESEKIKTVIINNNSDEYIKKYCNEVILFSGITGNNFKYIYKTFKANPKAKVFIIAERPNFYGNIFILIWRYVTRYIFYTLTALFYRNKISGFFAMGKLGVKTYKKYGWKEKKLFPFMYTSTTNIRKKNYKEQKQLKCLYIGRFYNQTKGINLLIEAVKQLKKKEIHLDLVGGYGKDFNKVINEIKNCPNIDYIGKWNYDEVNNKMANYDVVIVPSIYDGWNVVPNQAIDAEIGILVSNGAVSDELVKNANNGIVFKRRSIKEIKKALLYVLDNKDIIKTWSENSKKYKELISNDTISKYFLNVIDYCLDNKLDIPTPPWIFD